MKKIIFLGIFFIIIFGNICMANDNLYIKTENENVIKDDTFKIYVNLGDVEIYSYNLEIFFNSDIVEYVSGTGNTNVVDNKIINLWYDETGGNTPKRNQNIAEFEFKAKQKGSANFNLVGEFFDKNGNEININNAYLKVNIIENIEQIQNEENVNNNTTTEEKQNDASSLLKIMRLNKEGLIPEFSPEIKDYYFTTDMTTENLEVTAIPENLGATVTITGNTELKKGENKIQITVTSKDNKNKSIYNINVTKTDNKELANSNLEMLAIENVTLEPLFDVNILNYKANVSNNTEKLNILAIPENINSIVQIKGNENLKEGDNVVDINVVAPNGTTSKKYQIIVHRRTNEEDEYFKQEHENEVQKLNSILENLEQESSEIINDQTEKTKENQDNITKKYLTYMIIGIILIIGILIFWKGRKKHKT